ncbi:PRC-barrel domain containing protein [Aquabacterium fontiphilum]|uniref:PRC-barrel domain-containing protein n=1 Tax=Aquabacterium fontiphilum TaxID=450365 RepID=UPI001377D32B|nr:PRC-barrel domain-containing protein [Aquabacterium fontiphilum]NBD22136.1 PRC-barrel domain containing protein [Aquabacterium fontiphilum]
MKTQSTRQILAAVAVSLAASGAWAQTGGTGAANTGGTAAGTATPTARGGADDWQRIYRVSKIMGTDLRNARGEKIGDIKDIVVDRNGAITYAVVSTGGFLGIGDRLHAVPWSAVQNVPGRDYRLLDIDKNRLKDAPSFEPNNWPNVIDEKWSTENRRFYGVGAGQAGSASQSGSPNNTGTNTGTATTGGQSR